MQIFTILENQANQRFDKFLAKYLPEAPKSLIYKQLRNKNITLNRKKATGNEILKINDTVETFFSDETFDKFKGKGNSTISEDKEFNKYKVKIVYEDKNVLILDKPFGMLSQKANPDDYSINEWILTYLLNNSSISETDLQTFRPSICNRLDRNTTGLILCGKSLLGLQGLSYIIKEGKVQKHYQTICHGQILEKLSLKGTLDKDKAQNKSVVNNDDSLEANISTDFEPIKLYSNATLLDVNLHSGKPHQIRAQLAAINHPIWGDKKYCGKHYSKEDEKLRFQLLHAYKLIFDNDLPAGLEGLSNKTIEIDLPERFKKFVYSLE